MRIRTFILCSVMLALSNSNPALGDAFSAVQIPDQVISIRQLEYPDLIGTIQNGPYAGVTFVAEAESSIALPDAYRPENLLKKLDPSLVVRGVGQPSPDRPMEEDEILSLLPKTGFHLKKLIGKTGQRAVAGMPPILVYVSGYITASDKPPLTVEEIKEGLREDTKTVYISALVVKLGDLPPCSRFRICDK